MKRILKAILLFILSLTCIDTYAMQYKTVEIFTSDEKATVVTDTFTYTNFIYVPAKAGSKYGTIEFEEITNNTEKLIPVSINLLMFDKNKKNIGFITYCSTKDISSDYSQMKIKANAKSPFSITVTDTYFVDGYSAKDISYLAVLDENEYCYIGGYDKYKGLTIEQISDGVVASNLDDKGKEQFNIDSLFNKYDFTKLLSNIVISIVVLLIVGVLLNMINKRIFADSSILSYLPLTNCFIAIKCCFGKKISYVFLFILLISCGLFFVSIIGKVLIYMLFFISVIAFFIDIYKLITKKYDFCFYEPMVDNNYSVINDSNKTSSFINNEVDEPFINGNTGNQLIDLNFSSPNPGDDNAFSDNVRDSSYGKVLDKKKNSNKEGESELSKFFR